MRKQAKWIKFIIFKVRNNVTKKLILVLAAAILVIRFMGGEKM